MHEGHLVVSGHHHLVVSGRHRHATIGGMLLSLKIMGREGYKGSRIESYLKGTR